MDPGAQTHFTKYSRKLSRLDRIVVVDPPGLAKLLMQSVVVLLNPVSLLTPRAYLTMPLWSFLVSLLPVSLPAAALSVAPFSTILATPPTYKSLLLMRVLKLYLLGTSWLFTRAASGLRPTSCSLICENLSRVTLKSELDCY